MKLQLDTTNKIVKIEESVNLNDLFELLNKILPEVWQEFKLEVNTVINWSNPIVIEPYIYPVYPWWKQPYIYGTPNTNPYKTNYLSSGIYNIEC
jgi:hypothetical protein